MKDSILHLKIQFENLFVKPANPGILHRYRHLTFVQSITARLKTTGKAVVVSDNVLFEGASGASKSYLNSRFHTVLWDAACCISEGDSLKRALER
jgi:hypothetical protein